MAKRDATEKQLAKLKAIRKEFGHATLRTYRVDERTGHMRVEVTCAAGVWHWWFDRDANLIDRALHEPIPGAEAEDTTESAFLAWDAKNPVEP